MSLPKLNIGEQFKHLYDEHELAKDSYYKAFSAVGRKYGAAGNYLSSVEQTMEDVARFESASRAWDDVRQQMLDFVKANA